MENKHSILFAGTPDISVPLLKALFKEFHVAGVLTSTDKVSGRGKKIIPSPVKICALELGIPVLQFDSLRTEAREEVRKLKADTLITFAYGKIFGPKFLSLFEKGTFNVHPSALPLFRGPSPIQETVRFGLKKAVISLQEIGLKMDEGGIFDTAEIPLSGTETTDSLSRLVSLKAAEFVPSVLKEVFEGNVFPHPQVGDASYCAMVEKEDAKLDFSLTVKELHCKIRACYSWPKANACFIRDDTGKSVDLFITGVWGGFDYLDCPDTLNSLEKNGFLDKENTCFSFFSGELADSYAEKNTETEGNAVGIKAGTVVSFRKDRGIGVLCKDGILWINSLQLPSKKELDFKSFINGNLWIKKGVFA